jgi:Txe/YoeB family toxin of Txe-Axe toxin-antitoxin module
MGYESSYSGVLKFKNKPTEQELQKLETFMGEDCREHLEWNAKDLTWIDLQIDSEGDGICWNGSEKSYDMVEKVNMIIKEMKKEFPNFELKGEFEVQGEDIDDKWLMQIVDNVAYKFDVIPIGNSYSEDDLIYNFSEAIVNIYNKKRVNIVISEFEEKLTELINSYTKDDYI